jgi:hypothetical protein
MTDLEITRKCAEAMGCVHLVDADVKWGCYKNMEHPEWKKLYNPLHNNAQAMELVKRFHLALYYRTKIVTEPRWEVCADFGNHMAFSENLNRAICECVANMKEYLSLSWGFLGSESP